MGIRNSALGKASGDQKTRGKKKKTAKHFGVIKLLADDENDPVLSMSPIRELRKNEGASVDVGAQRGGNPVIRRLPTRAGAGSSGAGGVTLAELAGSTLPSSPRTAADGLIYEGATVGSRLTSPAQDP